MISFLRGKKSKKQQLLNHEKQLRQNQSRIARKIGNITNAQIKIRQNAKLLNNTSNV